MNFAFNSYSIKRQKQDRICKGLMMKLDVMSLAAVALLLGVVFSAVSIEDVFAEDPEPPTALQQGIALR